jgi:hypothetical protein
MDSDKLDSFDPQKHRIDDWLERFELYVDLHDIENAKR